MKKLILKCLNIIIDIVMVLSALYAMFNLIMTFLPAEIQSGVYGWLNMSKEYIATFSISSAINATILVGSKIASTYTKINLTKQLTKAENVNIATSQINSLVVKDLNLLIDNVKIVEEELSALMNVQKITAERNIGASDMIVLPEEKEAYKKAIDIIDKAQSHLQAIKNITGVYEKTEVKEVIVEIQKDTLEGRV